MILGVELVTPATGPRRPCVRVQYNDGFLDWVPLASLKNDDYEFKDSKEAERITHEAQKVVAASLNSAEREELQAFRREAVRLAMREISETYWCAGWDLNLAESLYHMVFEDASRDYGLGKVSEDEISRLKQYAELSNTWWHWPHDPSGKTLVDGEQPIDLDEAKELYGSKFKCVECGSSVGVFRANYLCPSCSND
jgi:hypothetical protein